MASIFDDFTSSLSSAYDSVTGAISEGWDAIFSAEVDRTTERINTAVDSRINERTAIPVNQSPTSVTPDQFRKAGQRINWQMLGVIVGAVGIMLTIAKMVK